MLTRSMYLAAGWFAISLLATLMGGYRVRKTQPVSSLLWLAAVKTNSMMPDCAPASML